MLLSSSIRKRNDTLISNITSTASSPPSLPPVEVNGTISTTTNNNNERIAPPKKRFIFQHVWKTGGTELCRLARANGWNVPEKPGCTYHLHPHIGWPSEDYDMLGNEGCIPGGSVDNNYFPQNEFADNERNMLSVHGDGVQWITTLRHPYSRTLSHFHHVKKGLAHQNLTLQKFLVTHGGGFEHFIPHQQTRWHCGTGPCSTVKHPVTEEFLMKAMDNLQKMDAVLILEDMGDAQSCTRRQMRHVLQFNTTETLSPAAAAAAEKSNHASAQKPQQRNSQSNWETAIHPFLDHRGSLSNASDITNRSPDNTTDIMAALGLHNSYDLQLYGYARRLCEELAAKYDAEEAMEEFDHTHANATELGMTTNISTTNNESMMYINQRPMQNTTTTPTMQNRSIKVPDEGLPFLGLSRITVANQWLLPVNMVFVAIFLFLQKQRRRSYER